MTDVLLELEERRLVLPSEARRDDQGDYVALISSVYTRIAGEWKLNLHQQTPIDSR